LAPDIQAERFRVALAASSVLVFNQDCNLRYTWIGNPALGATSEELVGRTDAEIMGEKAARPLTALKRRVLDTGVGAREELLVEWRDRSGWFDLTVEPLRDQAGTLVGITCAAIDLTERKQIDAALRKSEMLRFQALKSSQDLVFAVDHQYRLLFNNHVHQRILEENGEPPLVVGESVFSRAYPAEFIEWWRSAYDRGLKGESFVSEFEWTTDSGVRRVFEDVFSPLRDALGEIIGCFVAGREITERRRVQSALLEAQRLAGLGNWEWDLSSGRHSWSTEVYRIYGRDDSLPPAEYPEVARYFTKASWEHMMEVIESARTRGQPYECDAEVVRENGEHRWVIARGKALKDSRGKVVTLRGTLQDITERKRLEQERAEAITRLNEIQGEERRRISRDLHDHTAQMLVALSIGLKNLERSLADGRPVASQLQRLRSEVDEIQRQVREVAWALRTGERGQEGLENALRSYLEDWSERAQIAAEFECRGLAGVSLSEEIEDALYRVAQEALSNVRRHSKAHRVSVMLEQVEQTLRLFVEDDGCGFDPEQQRHSPVLGKCLGILGMRERVTLAGGIFIVESSVGSGTTILVRIPLPFKGVR